MWPWIIHHVCGEHEWEDGECFHGQFTREEGDKEILAQDSKAADELRKIVFDPDWITSTTTTSGLHVTLSFLTVHYFQFYFNYAPTYFMLHIANDNNKENNNNQGA